MGESIDILVDNPHVREERQGVFVFALATYNGQPPEEATQFVNFMRKARENAETPLKGAPFAVFGAGHLDWAATYQAMPKEFDSTLEALGGQRILSRGEAHSGGDLEGEFALWEAKLWGALAARFEIPLTKDEKGQSLTLPNVQQLPASEEASSFVMDYESSASLMTMTENYELRKGGTGSTRHIEFELPSGGSYKTGDHLAIYPENDPELVTEMMKILNLSSDTVISIDRERKTEKKAVRLCDWLLRAVDLSRRTNTRAVRYLASKADDETEKSELAALEDKVLIEKQMPLIELLQKYRSVKITLSEAVAFLPVMKPRRYSISSSAMESPGKVTISISVVCGSTKTGRIHKGVATNFLKGRKSGDAVWHWSKILVPLSVCPHQRHLCCWLVQALVWHPCVVSSTSYGNIIRAVLR